MIGQYLPNNNETATVAFRQKICQLNGPLYDLLRETLNGVCRLRDMLVSAHTPAM
jgi:hypothetical protein